MEATEWDTTDIPTAQGGGPLTVSVADGGGRADHEARPLPWLDDWTWTGVMLGELPDV